LEEGTAQAAGDDSDVETTEGPPAPILSGSANNTGREDLQTYMQQNGLTPQQISARLFQVKANSTA